MNNKKAFTLIEMMVSIGIIIILSSVFTASLTNYIGKANSASNGVESHQNKYEDAKTSVKALGGVTAAVAVVVVVPGTYTVSFNSQGGSTVGSFSGVPENTTITAPSSPTWTGHSFVAWYKESECNTAWNFGSDTVTGNVTLFAKWNTSAPAATFKVTFNYKTNTGLDTHSDITVAPGGSATPPTTPDYAGNTFDYWVGTYTNVTSDQPVTAKYKATTSAPVPVMYTSVSYESGWGGYTYACKAKIPNWTVPTYVTITLPAGAVAEAWYQCTIVSQTNGVVIVKVDANNTGPAIFVKYSEGSVFTPVVTNIVAAP